MSEGEGVPHALLSRVAHELRSPLGAILGWAHMLRRRADGEERERGLEVIEQSVHAQARLIDNLLDFSRIRSTGLHLDFHAVEPRAVIDAALRAVESEAAYKGLRVGKVLDLAAGPVRGDAGRLKGVVVNLLCNAIRFTPEEGTIEIALRRVGNEVEIAVTDSGRGLGPAELEHVFDGLPASDERKHGAGLGLAVARHVVQLHGGTLQAHSAGEGRGATFSVRVPLA